MLNFTFAMQQEAPQTDILKMINEYFANQHHQMEKVFLKIVLD